MTDNPMAKALEGDKMSNARSALEAQQLAAFTVIGAPNEVCGITLQPLTPGRLLVLEMAGSSLVKPGESSDYINELLQGLYILSAPREKLGIVTRMVSAKKSFLDAIDIIRKGEDPKTEAMFKEVVDCEKEWKDLLVEFGDTVQLLDMIEDYKALVTYIDNGLTAFKLRKKKAMTSRE